MGNLFKRPDKNCCPIYRGEKGLYRLETYLNDHIVDKWDGGGRWLWKITYRLYGREEIIISGRELKNFIRENNLRCVDEGISDRISVYKDKYKEYYIRKGNEPATYKCLIMYQEGLIEEDFLSYKDCLKYAEDYIREKENL